MDQTSKVLRFSNTRYSQETQTSTQNSKTRAFYFCISSRHQENVDTLVAVSSPITSEDHIETILDGLFDDYDLFITSVRLVLILVMLRRSRL